MASTVHEITFQGLLSPFDNSVLLVQLRRDGALWWARAIWDDKNSGAGDVEIGVLGLQVQLADGSWDVKRHITLTNNDTTIWTDETYNPPNDRKIRARFKATWSVSSYYPEIQHTASATT